MKKVDKSNLDAHLCANAVEVDSDVDYGWCGRALARRRSLLLYLVVGVIGDDYSASHHCVTLVTRLIPFQHI